MLRIFSDLVKVGAAVVTDDEKAAKTAAAEEKAAAIIAAMAARKSGVEIPKPAPAAEPGTATKPEKAAAAPKPEKAAKAAPIAADEDFDAKEEAAALEGLGGLEVEVLGCFVWVGGDTKKHRAKLKELGFRWSPNKERWYKRPAGYRKASRRDWTYEEIESKFAARAAA